MTIRDNTVAMAGGPSGGVTDSGYAQLFTDPSITWSGNVWRGVRGRPFWWADEELTLAQWQALGYD